MLPLSAVASRTPVYKAGSAKKSTASSSSPHAQNANHTQSLIHPLCCFALPNSRQQDASQKGRLSQERRRQGHQRQQQGAAGAKGRHEARQQQGGIQEHARQAGEGRRQVNEGQMRCGAALPEGGFRHLVWPVAGCEVASYKQPDSIHSTFQWFYASKQHWTSAAAATCQRGSSA